MDEIIKYFGVGLLTTTVLVSGYTLLFRITDTKRLITFAAIGFFSGTLLILCERITVIRMPVLGEIVAKAREDAMEISDIRKEVEKQRVQGPGHQGCRTGHTIGWGDGTTIQTSGC